MSLHNDKAVIFYIFVIVKKNPTNGLKQRVCLSLKADSDVPTLSNRSSIQTKPFLALLIGMAMIFCPPLWSRIKFLQLVATLKLRRDIQGPQRKRDTDFGDPLTFSVAPP